MYVLCVFCVQGASTDGKRCLCFLGLFPFLRTDNVSSEHREEKGVREVRSAEGSLARDRVVSACVDCVRVCVYT